MGGGTDVGRRGSGSRTAINSIRSGSWSFVSERAGSSNLSTTCSTVSFGFLISSREQGFLSVLFDSSFFLAQQDGTSGASSCV